MTLPSYTPVRSLGPGPPMEDHVDTGVRTTDRDRYGERRRACSRPLYPMQGRETDLEWTERLV